MNAARNISKKYQTNRLAISVEREIRRLVRLGTPKPEAVNVVLGVVEAAAKDLAEREDRQEAA